MILDLISINLRVPGIDDKDVLETLGAGIDVMLTQHKQYGLEFTEMSVIDHVKLTMGDHAAELCNGTDAHFEHIYETAVQQLDVLLAAEWLTLENFASCLDAINDTHVFVNKGVIRLYVNENE